MKNKIVGIVILMLMATTVVSATNINMKKDIQTVASGDVLSYNNKIVYYQPALFDWGVDQKQTDMSGYGITLNPPYTNAQSFTPTKDKLTAVSLYLFKGGAPPEPVLITVSIRDNLTHSDLVTKTIDTSVVTIKSSGTWVLFDFDDISITPGSKYFIVCSGNAGNDTNAYCWAFTEKKDMYNNGEAWYKADETAKWRMWMGNPGEPDDFCFKTYFRKPLDISVPKNNENLINPSTHVNMKEKIQPTSASVDVPVWVKGDSWTYELHSQCFTYNPNGTYYSTCFENMTETWTVTDVTDNNYTLQIIDKNISGKFFYGPYRWIFTKFMKLTGEDILRKTDLAEIQNLWVFKGLVRWLIGKINLPIPAQLTVSTLSKYSPPNTLVPFPLTAGTNGTLPNVHTTGYQKCTLYWGLRVAYNLPNVSGDTGSRKYTCEMENITVPAGTYNSFNVSVTYNSGVIHNYWRSYYVPEIGGFAKRSIHIDWSYNKPYLIQEYELVSTTYTP
jgi:hypothetical protein